MAKTIKDINTPFNDVWITDKADRNMIMFAEEVGKVTANKRLSVSQIRNIFGEIKRIQTAGFDNSKSAFIMLKPKVAYAYGRTVKSRYNKTTKKLTPIGNDGLRVFKEVFDTAHSKVEDEKQYSNFCDLMEAIIAYHKANGGKD